MTGLLVTGGAGFIGSNFIRWALERHPDLRVVNLDALTYAGNLESLADVEARFGEGSGERAASDGGPRYRFVKGDIRDFDLVRELVAGPVDAVVHFAAESHVDRSILGPEAFVDTNVKGTFVLLEACRAELERRAGPGEESADRPPFRFLHVSTDEVYGSLGEDAPAFTERTPLAPNSPYAASKAASDLLVRSYVETLAFPAVITRCSNNYGPYQFPEKLIPLMVTRALENQPLPVYGDGRNVRDWIHVEDHAEGVWAALTRGRVGEVYNLGGESELANLDVVHAILGVLEKPVSLVEFVADRPGHDRRYAMDIAKARRELGWAPRRTFEEGLAATVRWYVESRVWWERVQSEAYRVANAMYL